jgi:NitT/TauT family transport system permease protein
LEMELARSLRASPLQVFLKVRMSAALPFVFADRRSCSNHAGSHRAVIVGSVNGLCNRLLTANSQLGGPLACAALIWLSVLGIILFSAVAIAERLPKPWAGQH